MFYRISAFNTQALYAWASSPADVDRYVDWLNRNREINVYSAEALGETGYEDRDDVLSMDEPYWDDFMSDEA